MQDMSEENTHEEDEGNAERNAAKLEFTEQYAQRDDNRIQQYDVCNRSAVRNESNKPIHCLNNEDEMTKCENCLQRYDFFN